MNAVRNSSEHATMMAIGILFVILLLGAILVVVAKRGGFSSLKAPKGFEMLNPPPR